MVVNRNAKHKLTWREIDAKYKARGRAKAIRYDPEWESELDEMNKNKVGAPFKFSHNMMAFVAITRVLLGVSYRELEGYLDGSWGHEHNTPEFTVIWKRIGKNMPKLQAEDTSAAVDGRVLRLVVDATGMAMHNRGEWIRYKWRVKRGFFKIHLLIDLDTRRIVSFSMTGMDGGDAGQLPVLLSKALKRYAGESIPRTCQLAELMNAASINMTGAPADPHQTLLDDWVDGDTKPEESTDTDGKSTRTDASAGTDGDIKDLEAMVDEELLEMSQKLRQMGIAIEMRGDGGYDTRRLFSLLAKLDITPIIKVRINSNTRADGVDYTRAMAVLEQLGGGGDCTNRTLARMVREARLANQKDWKTKVRYGLRWIVEIVISAFKRIFGESIRALTPYTAYIEIATKITAYNHNLTIGDKAVQNMRDGCKAAMIPKYQTLLQEVAA